MDPNANLDEQRRIVKRMLTGVIDTSDCARLADLVESMDNWLSRGGALPEPWAESNEHEWRRIR